MRTEYEKMTAKGNLIGFYRITGSQRNFRICVNGNVLKDYAFYGDAYRKYNETIVEVG